MRPPLMRYCQALLWLWLQAQELRLPQFFLWGKAPLPASLAAPRQPLHFLIFSSVSSWGPGGTQLSHGKEMKLALLSAASICHHKVGETSRIVAMSKGSSCAQHMAAVLNTLVLQALLRSSRQDLLWWGHDPLLSKHITILGCSFMPWTSSGWELRPTMLNSDSQHTKPPLSSV